MPDLLFEDVCAQRVDEIRHLLDEPHAVDATTPLHRVTVFVTYRCNLHCAYCKTIVRSPQELRDRPQRAAVLDRERFAALLDGHGATPIEHLHFTGGEATLLRELPDMVRMAKAHGVRHVSITTNGTRTPDVYRRLVLAGIDEIRISLDDAHAASPAPATLRPAPFGRAIATIRTLGEMRREGHPFFLILNTVVERSNRERLPALLRTLLALHPDDIKLITAVDERDDLGDFEAAPRVRAELEAILAAQPIERFPLLRRKLETVFARDAIGLDTARAPEPRDWRCYVPLTERTVDGVHYYPCSVYLREGGRPLGNIDEPQELQRRRTADFVARGDCLSDPICRRYCLHCTARFNQQANDARAPLSAPR